MSKSIGGWGKVGSEVKKLSLHQLLLYVTIRRFGTDNEDGLGYFVGAKKILAEIGWNRRWLCRVRKSMVAQQVFSYEFVKNKWHYIFKPFSDWIAAPLSKRGKYESFRSGEPRKKQRGGGGSDMPPPGHNRPYGLTCHSPRGLTCHSPPGEGGGLTCHTYQILRSPEITDDPQGVTGPSATLSGLDGVTGSLRSPRTKDQTGDGTGDGRTEMASSAKKKVPPPKARDVLAVWYALLRQKWPTLLEPKQVSGREVWIISQLRGAYGDDLVFKMFEIAIRDWQIISKKYRLSDVPTLPNFHRYATEIQVGVELYGLSEKSYQPRDPDRYADVDKPLPRTTPPDLYADVDKPLPSTTPPGYYDDANDRKVR